MKVIVSGQTQDFKLVAATGPAGSGGQGATGASGATGPVGPTGATGASGSGGSPRTPYVNSRNVGNSFQIHSTSGSDVSNVAWLLVQAD
jgi:hypothetical protein